MTWDHVRKEIEQARDGGNTTPDDTVRRAKIAHAEGVSGIPLIIYVAAFTDEGRATQYGAGLQIDLNDKTGFEQAVSDIPAGGPLDVLVHSPGGSPTATESIVRLLRSRFDPIRFIVPHTAKSAATMLALSGNEILMGADAELGPIDPQLRFNVEGRSLNVPAQAAIDQFARAYGELKADPDKMRTWLPILRLYGPSFLQECQNAISLSETLVTQWLVDYMFAGDKDAPAKAERIATWLADHNNFNTHFRPVWMEQLLKVEPTMRITRLGDVGADFEEAIMAAYWAIDVTFNNTTAFKIIEHRAESAYVRLQKATFIAGPEGGPPTKVPAVRSGPLGPRLSKPARRAQHHRR